MKREVLLVCQPERYNCRIKILGKCQKDMEPVIKEGKHLYITNKAFIFAVENSPPRNYPLRKNITG